MLLLIVVSAATLLLDRLNAGIKSSVYNPETAIRLEEAKAALISWAINHPLNPGTLPIPDRNADGNYDGDADCPPGVVGNNLLLGRLPWRGYPAPCKDAASLTGLQISPGISSDIGTDRLGRVMWYAVSHNLVYESPDYPFISPAIVNKPDGWITVRDKNGIPIPGRIAFVVIAPGPPLAPYSNCAGTSYAGQNRSGNAPDISNFLDSVTIDGITYSNADDDQDFIMYPNSLVTNGDSVLEQCDQFNDQLVFVTIDELMDAVNQRVLNETANALSAWHNANGALPWLAPFADPKAEPKSLRGTATSSSNNLTDSSADFTEWGVTAGDTVWNLTDGSRATVTAVSPNTLTLSGLRFGTSNTFTTDDEYFVDVRYMPDILIASASGGSDGNTLRDSGRDFEALGIKPGDVIDNLDDGSSGIVSVVDGDEILVTALTGGSDNEFSPGDDYRIRTNTGEVTSDTANLTLIDTNADFVAMGVRIGDIVHNLWDSATGRITAINSATKLTVDKLALGTGVVFNSGEPYQITRYKGRTNTRSGLLPIHKLGEIFPSGFNIEWNLSGGTIATTLATDGTYTNALSSYVGSSSISGMISIPESEAACQWLGSDLVRCKGIYEDSTATFLAGTATTGSSNLVLRDSTKNFITLGAKRGDKVRNLTDGTTGIVFNTSSTQLTLVNINSMSNVGISVGDNYQLELAASSFSFDAVSPSSSYATRVYYNPAIVNESLLAIGDTIENTEGFTSIGIIESVNTGSNYIVHSVLTGGGYTDIFAGETVRIKHNFVNKRQYQFDVTLKGTSVESATGGIRARAVCRGYDITCTTVTNNTSFKGDASTAWITIRDYEGTTQVGQATNTISTGGLASRSLRISGLKYDMDENTDDLPDWFIRNKWYQYITVAYNNGDTPGGMACTAGTDCLTVNVRNSSNAIVGDRDNIRAVVMLSGNELSGQSWGNATAADYFDDAENTDTNDIFDKRLESNTFNDLIRIATSCPTDTTKLCWSN